MNWRAIIFPALTSRRRNCCRSCWNAEGCTEMKWETMARGFLPVLGAGMLFGAAHAAAAPQHFERHFAVKGRPVVVIQNVANGRIEVKSSKNPEVVVAATQASNKINIDAE